VFIHYNVNDYNPDANEKLPCSLLYQVCHCVSICSYLALTKCLGHPERGWNVSSGRPYVLLQMFIFLFISPPDLRYKFWKGCPNKILAGKKRSKFGAIFDNFQL